MYLKPRNYLENYDHNDVVTECAIDVYFSVWHKKLSHFTVIIFTIDGALYASYFRCISKDVYTILVEIVRTNLLAHAYL